MNHEHSFSLGLYPDNSASICRYGSCRGCGKQFDHEVYRSCPHCGDERLPKLHTRDGQYVDCCDRKDNPWESV